MRNTLSIDVSDVATPSRIARVWLRQTTSWLSQWSAAVEKLSQYTA